MEYTFTAPQTWLAWTDEQHTTFWGGAVDVEEILASYGYYPESLIQDDDYVFGALRVWSQGSEPTASFYAIVEINMPGSDVLFVYCQTPIDFLAFVHHYGTLGFLSKLEHDVAQLTVTMARWFRAEHGHDATDYCSRCDPTEMRIDAMHRERRKKGTPVTP